MNKTLKIFMVFTLFPLISAGQNRSELIQQRIEFISEQLESEEIDLTNVIEQLNYYSPGH